MTLNIDDDLILAFIEDNNNIIINQTRIIEHNIEYTNILNRIITNSRYSYNNLL